MKNEKKPQSSRPRASRRVPVKPAVATAAGVGPQRMVARNIFGRLDEGHRRRLVLFVGPANSGLAPAAALWFGALATEGKATVVLAYPDGAPAMLSPELMLALSEDGLEPRRLLARPLTPELVAAADLVVTMSGGARSRMKLPPTTRRREHWTISQARAKAKQGDLFTPAMQAFVPGARIAAFGHMGDGNIHYDVIRADGGSDAEHAARRDQGSRIVHDIVASMGGSISAEHGLGSMKTEEARRYKSPVEIEALSAIRRALDPKRIMNPRVLF